jgi:hypothetical protein
LLGKLTHYAEKYHMPPLRKFSTAGKHRKLTISKNTNRQTIHIFGEGIAIYELFVGFLDNASEGQFPFNSVSKGGQRGYITPFRPIGSPRLED